MKKILSVILMGFLGMVALTTAFAGWECRVHNARGQVWYGTAPTRAAASANAIGFCASGSAYARNCVLDYCQGGDSSAPGGTWQCNATNARGQLWIGTGPTRAVAAANAAGFCAAHSAYARNCVIRSCFQH